jgi:membrane peptidoglycan carboxypeptidase
MARKIRITRLLSRTSLIVVLFSVAMVLPFRWIDPPVSMVMLERNWQQRGTDYHIKKQWLSWNQIPHHAALAAVVSEDQNFPHHYGFDLKAIKKAFAERDRRGSLRGASTISQQVARNMYLDRSELAAQGSGSLVHWVGRAMLAQTANSGSLFEHSGMGRWRVWLRGSQSPSLWHFCHATV